MIRQRVFVTAAIALTFGLSGCGGGGSGGGAAPDPGPGTGSALTPSPAPAPTPAPTPIATLPPAPFGITASQQFQPFGWHRRDDVTEPLTPQLVDFRWSATAGTYEMVLPDVGRGRLEYRFPGSSNRVSFELVGEDGMQVPVEVLVDDTTFYDPPYRSSGLLSWTTIAPAPPRTGTAVFGLPTSMAGMPAAGQRIYLAQGGEAFISFDFARGQFTGYVRLAWTDAWGPYPFNQYDLTQTSFLTGTNGLEARFTVPGAPFEGVLRGQFMGMDANEMALAWRGPVQNPYTEEWEEQSGVWLARVCEDCRGPN